MSKPLSGVKVAMLVANGFSQDDMITTQKALIEAGANVRIVSPENGLVNSWDGQGWGHHFAVDAPLGTALSADYAVLVIPGGQRSMEKLNLTAHTKRFVTSFMDADKPVIAIGDALNILILTDNIKGRTVTGPQAMHDVILQAGAKWGDVPVTVDDQLLSGVISEDNKRGFVDAMLAHLIEEDSGVQAA